MHLAQARQPLFGLIAVQQQKQTIPSVEMKGRVASDQI